MGWEWYCKKVCWMGWIATIFQAMGQEWEELEKFSIEWDVNGIVVICMHIKVLISEETRK